MRTILVEGGSTAYGMFDNERGGWAARLTAETMPYNSAHITSPILVKNYGVPGRTIVSVTREFGQHVLPYRRLGSVGAVLSAGLNEAKILPSSGGASRVTIEQFHAYLETYRDQATSLEVPTVFVGLQPVDERKNDVLGTGFVLEDDVVEAFDEIIRAHAAEAGMPYIDTRGLFMEHSFEEVMHKDGRHPSALGHAILHEAIRDALVEVGALPADYDQYLGLKRGF